MSFKRGIRRASLSNASDATVPGAGVSGRDSRYALVDIALNLEVPQTQNKPAQICQVSVDSRITRTIAGDFLVPEPP
jgi:hypothetical protein